MSHIDGKLYRLTRLMNSANGNPRWEVIIDNQEGDLITLVTSSDHACSYEINNPKYRDVPVRFHLTRAGRIQRIERVTPE